MYSDSNRLPILNSNNGLQRLIFNTEESKARHSDQNPNNNRNRNQNRITNERDSSDQTYQSQNRIQANTLMINNEDFQKNSCILLEKVLNLEENFCDINLKNNSSISMLNIALHNNFKHS